MAESFENLDNILRDWAKDKIQKVLSRETGRKRKVRFCSFFRNWLRKNTRAVSVGSRPRLNQTLNWSWNKLVFCLAFNKPNKQIVYEINLSNRYNFTHSRKNYWHRLMTDRLTLGTSKHHLQSVIKNKDMTLLSDANFPVRFRARQGAKYSSLQLTGNCVAVIRCPRHYVKLIWECKACEYFDVQLHVRKISPAFCDRKKAWPLNVVLLGWACSLVFPCKWYKNSFYRRFYPIVLLVMENNYL